MKKNKFESVIDFYSKFSGNSERRINRIHKSFDVTQSILGPLRIIFDLFRAQFYCLLKGKSLSFALLAGSVHDIYRSSVGPNDDEAVFYIRIKNSFKGDAFSSSYAALYVLFLCFSFVLFPFFIFDYFRFSVWRFSKKYQMKFTFFSIKSIGYSVLFFLFKVKKIYLVDGYSTNMAAVYAGKKQKIKVVEIQHGIISKGHVGYNRNYLDKNFYPDSLVVWDERFKPEIPILVSGFVECSVCYDNPLCALDVCEGGSSEVIIIGQPSISQKLDAVVSMLDDITHVVYKPHPRELFSKEIERNIFLESRYSRESLVIGGFSTLLLELKCSGVENVIAIEEFVPKNYSKVLEIFGVRLVCLDDIKKATLEFLKSK